MRVGRFLIVVIMLFAILCSLFFAGGAVIASSLVTAFAVTLALHEITSFKWTKRSLTALAAVLCALMLEQAFGEANPKQQPATVLGGVVAAIAGITIAETRLPYPVRRMQSGSIHK